MTEEHVGTVWQRDKGEKLDWEWMDGWMDG
jgi:hypothetical protein